MDKRPNNMAQSGTDRHEARTSWDLFLFCSQGRSRILELLLSYPRMRGGGHLSLATALADFNCFGFI